MAATIVVLTTISLPAGPVDDGVQFIDDPPLLMTGPVAIAGPDLFIVEGLGAAFQAGAIPAVNWSVQWTDDFESYPAGPMSSPWVDESAGGTNYVEIQAGVGTGGSQAMHIVDQTGGTTGLGSLAARAVTGTYLELTTWARADTTTGVFTPMLSTGPPPLEWQAVRSGMGPIGRFIYGVCAGASWTTSSLVYAADTWYEIRFVADTTANEFHMWVDGVPIAANEPMCGTGTAFDFVRQASAGSYVGEFYVDDVTVREGAPIPITDYAWDRDALVDEDGDGNFTNDRDLLGPNPFSIYKDDGVYLATLTVTDALGNTANDTTVVTVANAPPSLAITAPTPIPLSSTMAVIIDAQDAGSDDLTINWSWSDGLEGNVTFLNGAAPDPPMSPNGTAPFLVSHTANRTFVPPAPANYTVYVQVEDDDGGSASEVRTIEVRDVPDTSLTIGPPSFIGATTYINGTSALNLTAVDHSGLGINATRYQLDSGPVVPYSAPFTISAPGPHVLTYWSEDNLGGVEPSNVRGLHVDAAPPTTDLVTTGPKVDIGSTTWIAPTTLFELEATDAASGVAESWHRQWDGTSWTSWSDSALPFSPASGSGAITVEVYSIDNLGQEEAVRSEEFVVDGTPPEIEVHAVQSTQDYGLTIVAEATDAGSGVDTLEYRIGGGDWTAYEAPIVWHGKEPPSIDFRARDNVGNEREESPDLPSPAFVNVKPILSVVLAVIILLAGFLLSRRSEKASRNVLLVSIAFAVAEIGIGVSSALLDVLMVPPWLGAGTLVNLGVTAGAVLSAFVLSRRTAPTPATPPPPPPNG